MAQATALRGAGNAVAYGVLGLMAVTNDTLAQYAKEIVRTTMHFLSRPSFVAGGAGGAGGPGGAGAGAGLATAGLEDKIDRLAASLVAARGSTLSALGASLRGPTMFVVLASGAGVLLLRLMGTSVAEVWWVTRAQFRATTDALREGVSAVASALTKVRAELLERIGVVDANVDRTRAELKADVSNVAVQVRDVSDTLATMETKLNGIEAGMKTANRGIFLLCHVVSDQFGGAPPLKSAGLGAPGDGSPAVRPLYRELTNYTREFSVGGAAIASAASSSGSVVAAPSARLLSASNSADLGVISHAVAAATAKQSRATDPTESLRQELVGRGIIAG